MDLISDKTSSHEGVLTQGTDEPLDSHVRCGKKRDELTTPNHTSMRQGTRSHARSARLIVILPTSQPLKVKAMPPTSILPVSSF